MLGINTKRIVKNYSKLLVKQIQNYLNNKRKLMILNYNDQ